MRRPPGALPRAEVAAALPVSALISANELSRSDRVSVLRDTKRSKTTP